MIDVGDAAFAVGRGIVVDFAADGPVGGFGLLNAGRPTEDGFDLTGAHRGFDLRDFVGRDGGGAGGKRESAS